MTIEVRQLIIRSTVQPESGAVMSEQQAIDDLTAFKERVMSECRELVAECIREQAER